MFVRERLYRLAFGSTRPLPAADLDIRLSELVGYLWARGGRAYLRGLLMRHRFGRSNGRLFIGKHTRILFPRYICAGYNVYLGDFMYLNALSRDGIRLGNNVRIHEHGWIQATSTLDNPGKGLVIGDDTYIGPRSYIGAGGGITIGGNVLMGASVNLLAEDHRFQAPGQPISTQGLTRKGIVIEDDVWIGNGVIVLDGVTIGRGAVVGAGSVVTRDIPPDTVAVGNPCRMIARRTGERV